MTTLLVNGKVSELPAGAPIDGGPWAPLAELEQLSGWSLKPEGACLGDLCVPLSEPLRAGLVCDSWFNLGALAGHLGQPIVRDEASDTWVIAEAAVDRSAELASLEAPNFTLPDHRGQQHQLTDYRGKKVFLVSWASW
jgi:hypothetical protein